MSNSPHFEKAGPSSTSHQPFWTEQDGHPILNIPPTPEPVTARANAAITSPMRSPTHPTVRESSVNSGQEERYLPYQIPETMSLSQMSNDPDLQERRLVAVTEARRRWRKNIVAPPAGPLNRAQRRQYSVILHRLELILMAYIEESLIPQAEEGNPAVPVLMEPQEFQNISSAIATLLSQLDEEARIELVKMCPIPDFPLVPTRRTFVPFQDYVLAATLYREEVETFLRFHHVAYQLRDEDEAKLRRERRRTSGLSTIDEYKPLSGSTSLRDLPPHMGRILSSRPSQVEFSPPPYPPSNPPHSRKLNELLAKPSFLQESPDPVPPLSRNIFDSSSSFTHRSRSSSVRNRPTSLTKEASSFTAFESSLPPAAVRRSKPPNFLQELSGLGMQPTGDPGNPYTALDQNRLAAARDGASIAPVNFDNGSNRSSIHQQPSDRSGSIHHLESTMTHSNAPSRHSTQSPGSGGNIPPIYRGGGGPSDPDNSSSDDGDGQGRRNRNHGRGGRRRLPPRAPRVSLGSRLPNRDLNELSNSFATAPRVNPPQFDHKLKTELIPEWDGNPDTLARWFQVVNLLSERSEFVYKQLGDIAPYRLTDRAATWFYGLDSIRRREVMVDWGTLKDAIYTHFMNRSWLDKQKRRAMNARYRDSSAPHETPSDYGYRKKSLLNIVSDWTDSQLISEIMEGAPDFWAQIIDTQRLSKVEQLHDAISYHEDRLLYSSRGSSSDDRKVERLQEQVNSILNRMNRANRPPFKTLNQAKVSKVTTGFSKNTGGPQVGAHPSIKPPFPRDDSNVTKKGQTPAMKGARNCRHCGSGMHWDNECKHSKKGNKLARTNAVSVSEEFKDALNAYEDLYYATTSSESESSDGYNDNDDDDDESGESDFDLSQV